MPHPCNFNDVNGYQSNGQCCCNCEHQRPINAHPWNENALVKGSVTTIVGYGCTCPEFFPDIGFMERKHSLCEFWTKNTWREEMAAEDLKHNKEWVWNILTRK
jgi:hypothetical protein